MSLSLLFRPEAENETIEAFDWYENRVPGLGAEFLLCLDAVLNSISRNPRQYQPVHRSVRRALMRRFPYEVLFMEDDERIVVLSVFHARRDPAHWQERISPEPLHK